MIVSFSLANEDILDPWNSSKAEDAKALRFLEIFKNLNFSFESQCDTDKINFPNMNRN